MNKPKRTKGGRPPRKPEPTDAEREELAKRAIDWPRATLQDIASQTGISRATLAAYRSGERRLTDEATVALSGWLWTRSFEAKQLAESLIDTLPTR
jgi:transcriptional regulator with XRE-family HTH domain